MQYHEQYPPVISTVPELQYGHNPGQTSGLLIDGTHTGMCHSLYISILRKGSEAPLHVHSREDETFYLIEGSLDARVGDEHYTLNAGQAVFLPRGLKHRLRCLSETAKVLMIIHPAGLENFFRRIDSYSEHLIDPSEMAEIASEYGVTILKE
jgi:mannose-6-phosphate isomerase-like protein (cupin superfamily)